MIESDTIKLLRECDAGIKMGVASIDDVLGYVHDGTFRKYLADCKDEHDKLKEEIQTFLEKYHDDGKEPNPMAKGMSWMKKYLNQYKAADEKTKDITKRLIKLEEKLAVDIRPFL